MDEIYALKETKVILEKEVKHNSSHESHHLWMSRYLRVYFSCIQHLVMGHHNYKNLVGELED